MIDYFTQAEYLSAKKRKNVLLAIFFVVLTVYLGISATFVGIYTTMPYASPRILPWKIIHHAITVVFVVGMFFYMCVPFKRANKYYKMLVNMKSGIRETNIASFFEYDETLQEKDGVDCKALVFLEWNKYKKDVFERKVLVFYDKPFPELNEKDTVKFITQGNVLISYEIINSATNDEDLDEADEEIIAQEKTEESEE